MIRRAFLLAALVSLLVCTAALADGDPASDYLYTSRVFTPSGASHRQAAELRRVVDEANAAGEPIKVAVIASPYDLGSITPLWGQPSVYARFLGIELSARFHGLLLVEMPAGFGLYHGGHAVSRERSALGALTPHGGAAGLMHTAAAAVESVSAADGHPFAPPAPQEPNTPHKGGSGAPRWIALGLVALGLLLIAVAGLALAVATRGRTVRRPSGRTVATAAWLAAAAGVTAVGIHHFAFARQTNALAAPTQQTPFTWRPGAFPAPGFTLHDEHGRSVTMPAAPQRVTVLAFIDPVCRNFCPREASVLGAVERALGPGNQAPIDAISVDPWGQARATLLTDDRHWRVGPSWRWAIGTEAALRRVWSDYKVGVRVNRVRVNGVAVHEITHDELIYIVDARGSIRAMFPYPFSAGPVEQTIRSIQEG